MKNVIVIVCFLFSASIYLSSCAKVAGCMNKSAINYNSSASSDDGSCQQSAVVFYCVDTILAGRKVLPLQIYFDATFIGRIDSAAIVAPGNCSTSLPLGVYVSHIFTDSLQHAWTAVNVHDSVVAFSGFIRGSANQPCNTVNVY